MKELDALDRLGLEELREEVTERLVQRFSRESIGIEDFERRTAVVTKAATKAEILQAIVDLPEEAPDRPPAVQRRSAGRAYPEARAATAWRLATAEPKERESVICIFGGTDRKGVWTVPRNIDSICLFGGANLDLRKAVIPPEGITIKAMAVFGGLDIIVPPDLRLDVRGVGIFGGFDHRETPDAPEDAPLVRIEGLAFFGGVSVRVKA